MKNIFIGIAVIAALLVGGFFALNAYIYNEKQGDMNRVVTTGTVTAIDLEPLTYDGPGRIVIITNEGKNVIIEVPARMNLCEAKDNIADVGQIALNDTLEVTGDVTEEGVLVPCESEEHYLRVTRGGYIDRALGFGFEYKKGNDGYVLNVPPHGNEEAADFEDAVIVYHKPDYEAMQNAEGTEGPPTINVLVYRNTKKMSARAWADANAGISNIGAKIGSVIDTSLNGAKGIRYVSDGLYRAETLVVTFGDFVYFISGSYSDEASPIHQDFQTLLNSFTFFTPR